MPDMKSLKYTPNAKSVEFSWGGSTHYYHSVTSHRLLFCFLPYFLFYTFIKPYHIGPQVTSTYLAARGKIGEFVSYIAFEVAFSTLSCKNVSMNFYYVSATCNMM